MLVLGIGDHVSCGSALVENGKIVSAITDERLIREKMVFGVPRQSIKQQIEMHDLSASDIDIVAIGTKNQHLIDGYIDFRDGWFGLQRGRFKQVLFELAADVSHYRHLLPSMDRLYYAAREPAFRKRRWRLQEIMRDEFQITCPVHFIEHHFCHIASAYYTSGYRSATVFSVDGGGDGKSGSVYDVVDGRFTRLTDISSFDSLGNFYSYITQLCGFKGGKHEGKITGMAAYGDPIYLPILQDMITYEDGGFKNIGNVFFSSALEELKRRLPRDFLHKDLAASVQVLAEEMVVELVKYWLAKTGQCNVALAGGVIANVRINQQVHLIPRVSSVFIHPGMSDEGIPVGAALAAYYENSVNIYEPEKTLTMEHVFIGPSYDNDIIEQEIDRHDLNATYHEQIELVVAELLAEGAVVARFNGRMEYGPRALGNRSILYRPDDRSVQYWLNEALQRTEFMPFAPVVLMSEARKCFVDLEGIENTARFMTITCFCTKWMIEHCPGVVHVDGTARPQLIQESDNIGMYEIVNEYHRITGLPCLINTSFNMHEEPIVCSPADAIRAFKLGHLDYLAIGDWLLKNEAPLRREVDSAKYERLLNRRGVAAETDADKAAKRFRLT
jgi:carbamoyltransferase